MSNPEQWDQCSEQTRKVLTLAHQEAQRLQQERVGTEHLLLGLLLGGEGRIIQVLHSLAIDPQKLRRDVEFVIGHGDRAAMEEIKLTRLASKVLEQALKEAHRLKQQLIGPEHVLLGLVGVQECIPAGLLESRGATFHAALRRSWTFSQKIVKRGLFLCSLIQKLHWSFETIWLRGKR